MHTYIYTYISTHKQVSQCMQYSDIETARASHGHLVTSFEALDPQQSPSWRLMTSAPPARRSHCFPWGTPQIDGRFVSWKIP